MRKRIAATLALVILFLVCTAQIRISGEAVTEDTSPPLQGSTWLHTTTKDVLHYSTDFDKWIGPVELWEFGNAGDGKTGAMKFAHTVSTFAADNEIGAPARGRMRIIAADLMSDGADAPNCTLVIKSDATTILKLEWPETPKALDIPPTADSSAVWIAPSTRVIVPDGEVLSMSIVAAQVPDNPDNPGIILYMVREEDP